uniref:Uncharacterized protein n=1 Tax=Paramormyrops kingsleyae TaxID=1676925 RepID=A0A3B3SHP0_9TELE
PGRQSQALFHPIKEMHNIITKGTTPDKRSNSGNYLPVGVSVVLVSFRLAAWSLEPPLGLLFSVFSWETINNN